MRADESQPKTRYVNNGRDHPLDVLADGGSDVGIIRVRSQDGSNERVIGQGPRRAQWRRRSRQEGCGRAPSQPTR